MSITYVHYRYITFSADISLWKKSASNRDGMIVNYRLFGLAYVENTAIWGGIGIDNV